MKKNGLKILFTVWLIAFAWGLTGLYQRFAYGHEMANYGSYVPWGLWVSGYIYLIGLSAGAFLLSSLIYVFSIEKLRFAGRLSLFVAAITLPLALLCICLDLGHIWRSYTIFTRPNFTSMMTWMVWLYSAYFLLIGSELWFEMRLDLSRLRDRGGPLSWVYSLLLFGWRSPSDEAEAEQCEAKSRKVLKVLGGLGIPLAISFHGGVGALFATVSAKVLWHTGLFPILFLTGALVSGGALLMGIIALIRMPDHSKKTEALKMLARIVLALLAFDMILEWAELSIPMWYQIGPEYHQLFGILFGETWYVFWIFHILLGTLIPAGLLLAKSGSPKALALAGFLIASTFLAVRMNVVIPAQLQPALNGLREAYVDSRLLFSYVPSAFEWSIIALVISMGGAFLYLGLRYLPLVSRGDPRSLKH